MSHWSSFYIKQIYCPNSTYLEILLMWRKYVHMNNDNPMKYMESTSNPVRIKITIGLSTKIYISVEWGVVQSTYYTSVCTNILYYLLSEFATNFQKLIVLLENIISKVQYNINSFIFWSCQHHHYMKKMERDA